MSMDAVYTIKPIFLGSMTGDKANSLHNYPKGEMIRSIYACYALCRDEEVILVDTGLPAQEDIIQNNKPFRRMSDAPDFLKALAKANINPDKIKTVILTHLHYDHCCNLRLLQHLERIYVQKREVLYAFSPKKDDFYYYSLNKECGKPEWTDGLGKYMLTDGDEDILPGIKVLLTPGHSPGSQTVQVNTAEGPYLLTGDFIPLLDSFEKRIPNAILHNIDDWYESYEKIKNTGITRILPGHDACALARSVYGEV